MWTDDSVIQLRYVSFNIIKKNTGNQPKVKTTPRVKFCYTFHYTIQNTTSTVYFYWCIASKLKVPLIFGGMNKTFLSLDLSIFNQLLLWWYYTDKKSLPDIGGTTIQDIGPLAPMLPGVHTMSCTELILQIWGNIFLAFRWILMMRQGHDTSHYTTAKLSVHVWNHDFTWWCNKIYTQKKTFPQDYDYELLSLRKTKLPNTMVKEQTPSTLFQKSRAAER